MPTDEPMHEHGIEIDPEHPVAPGAPSGEGPAPALRLFTKVPLAIVVAMYVAGAVLWRYLPDEGLPVHWGISGAADAWAPKGFLSVFALPTIALVVYAVLVAVPFADPKRRNLMRSVRAYNVVLDLMAGLMAVAFAASMVAAFRPGFDVSRVLLAAMGVMFVVLGLEMSTVKQNYTFGVRTSWTLADEVVWERTNRLGGRLFAGAGVITLLGALLPGPANLLVMLGVLAVITVVMMVYPFLLYRSRHPEG